MSVDYDDLKNLPTSDKLRIVELLWDDIGAAGNPIELHAWQFDEASRRSSETKADPPLTIDRDELWHRVDG